MIKDKFLSSGLVFELQIVLHSHLSPILSKKQFCGVYNFIFFKIKINYEFSCFVDIIGLALIGWIADNRFSKNGNLIAFHTSKENKKSFETFLPADRFSNLWKK